MSKFSKRASIIKKNAYQISKFFLFSIFLSKKIREIVLKECREIFFFLEKIIENLQKRIMKFPLKKENIEQKNRFPIFLYLFFRF